MGVDMDGVILVFYLREGRRKALTAARAEALCLLRDLHPTAPGGGPGGERGGVFWIALPPNALDRAVAACPARVHARGGLARRHRLEANTHSRRLAFIRGPQIGRQVKVSVL